MTGRDWWFSSIWFDLIYLIFTESDWGPDPSRCRSSARIAIPFLITRATLFDCKGTDPPLRSCDFVVPELSTCGSWWLGRLVSPHRKQVTDGQLENIFPLDSGAHADFFLVKWFCLSRFVCLWSCHTENPPENFFCLFEVENAYEWCAVLDWQRSSRSEGTPAMDLGHLKVILKWCMCLLINFESVRSFPFLSFQFSSVHSHLFLKVTWFYRPVKRSLIVN